MFEIGLPFVALAMLMVALSRMRREMYGSGMLFIAGGLALLLHTGMDASATGGRMSLGFISPALCLTDGHRC